MAERCDSCGQQTEYNGWPTYETWLVNLWLSNDQGTYNMVRERAIETLREESELSADFRLSEWLKDTFDEDSGCAPDIGSSMYFDLLRAAFGRVEWRRIAESWIEDAREELEVPNLD